MSYIKDLNKPFSQTSRATLPGLDSVDSPAFERAEVESMRESYWDVVHDLIGGTKVMQAAREKYLPREPREKVTKYDIRLKRSVLFNGYKDALTKIVSKPFGKPVSIKDLDNQDERIIAISKDMNLRGENITTFSSKLFFNALNTGACHIFVDYPSLPEGSTLRDETEQGIRPLIKQVRLQDVLGWKEVEQSNGKFALTEIRFLEEAIVEEGEYGCNKQYVIKKVTATTVDTYILKDDKWIVDPSKSYTHSFGSIPIVTCYLNDEGFMTAKPVFMDLAWLNVTHWQSSSDQRNILRFARVGLYYAQGFTQEEVDDIVIGPNQVVHSSNPESDFKVVEYTGSSIEQGRKDLEALERQMQTMGMAPLIEKASNITATASSIEDNKSLTLVQFWIRLIENTLENAFALAAKWINVELTEEFSIDIFSDFAITSRVSNPVELLIQMADKRKLTLQTFLEEVKRRGVINEDVDIEAEVEALNSQPDLGLFGSMETPNEEEEN